MSHKQKIILMFTGATIILFTGGAFAYVKYNVAFNQPSPSDLKKTPVKDQPTTTPKPVEPPKPVLVESSLDGTMVEPSLAQKHPLAVMIENHPQARPQIGLTNASIVYEALAEGGITRFMAIFGPNLPSTAGPVRSARTYYVDWAEEYNAYYAHFGGASDALKKIRTDGVHDLDGMKIGKPLFWRTWYPGVTGSEHTAFTNPQKLYTYSINTKKWSTANTFTKYTFKNDPPVAERSAGGTLTIDFSGNANFKAKFVYDPTTNTYLRYLAGVAHKDRLSGAQITPKNIIAQYTTEIIKAHKKDHDLKTIGSGTAKYFIDGKMTTGTWSKSTSASRTIFKDASGAQVIFNRGQTWIAVVRPSAPVAWTPAPAPSSTTP